MAYKVLLAAVQSGNAELVRYLLDRGLTLCGNDADGIPRALLPLMVAASSSKMEIARLLKGQLEANGRIVG